MSINAINVESPTIREAVVNNPDQNAQYNFCSNIIRTHKYTVNPLKLDFFVWKNLYEQFMRVANIYFLVIAGLQLIPGLSPTGRFTTLLTLSAVMSVSAAKAAYEDYFRHRNDRISNSQLALVLRGESFEEVQWKNLQVEISFKLKRANIFQPTS